MEEDPVLPLKDGKDRTDTEKREGLWRKEEHVHRAHRPERSSTAACRYVTRGMGCL